MVKNYCGVASGFRIDTDQKTVQPLHFNGSRWETAGQTRTYPLSPAEVPRSISQEGVEADAWQVAWLLFHQSNRRKATELADLLTRGWLALSAT